ncbi:hypothetical protein K435DRAFT_855994 [Dendrothele bispora CBS 962.96]|uniref:Uncharacterized protein n=1 Tax=Dendrothele bispora (strain CBS 962.96) TaxID=1314807 RepID=A0A4S8M9U9_DENBC|nr:hypothetical protein K435DRAFT_855994 [Dendrothele bispora CBS 962.96]
MTQPSEEFSGCSPKLFTNLGPEGASGQRFKYYLLKDGKNAGIYMDQKIASAFARRTNQSEPKGYREDQEQQIIDVWKYHCSTVHDHPPSDQLPFIDPFSETPTSPTTPTRVHWEEEIDKTVRMADLLTLDAAPLLLSRRSPTKVTSSSTTPRQNQTTFAKLGSSSVETEVQEEVQMLKLFVVRFSGGADFYDNWDNAFKAFLDLMRMDLKPVMRTTADPMLAQNFANFV